MMRITIVYPKTENGYFDVKYYCDVHSRLAIERLREAIVSFSIEIGKEMKPFPPPQFIAAGHYLCNSIEEFLKTYMLHADELQLDVRNYTNIEPIVQISHVFEVELSN